MNETTLIAILVVLLCLIGLWQGQWLLRETRKGQRLERWMGAKGGLRVLRLLLVLGLIFGLLLVSGMIEPVWW